jgi:hypothetical protein
MMKNKKFKLKNEFICWKKNIPFVNVETERRLCYFQTLKKVIYIYMPQDENKHTIQQKRHF